MAAGENIGYRVLDEHAAEIISELAEDPLSVSAELFAKGFIADPQHKSMQTAAKADEVKAGELVEQVKRKVKKYPHKYQEFLDILTNFTWLKDMAKACDEYGKMLLQEDHGGRQEGPPIRPKPKHRSDQKGAGGSNRYSCPNVTQMPEPETSLRDRSNTAGVITDQRHQKLERIVRKQVERGFASNLGSVHRELLELFQKYITELPINQLENLKKKFEPTLQSKEGQKRESEEVEALRQQIAQQEEQIKQLRKEMQLTEEDTQEEPPQQSEEEDQTKFVESLRQKVDQQEKEIERLNKKKCIIL